jgi:hypothetical protein
MFDFDKLLASAKSIHDIAVKLEHANLLDEIGNIRMELAKLKSAYADLQNDNTTLKARLEGRGSSLGSAKVIRG